MTQIQTMKGGERGEPEHPAAPTQKGTITRGEKIWSARATQTGERVSLKMRHFYRKDGRFAFEIKWRKGGGGGGGGGGEKKKKKK